MQTHVRFSSGEAEKFNHPLGGGLPPPLSLVSDAQAGPCVKQLWAVLQQLPEPDSKRLPLSRAGFFPYR
jgi:hypothetical protein